MIDLAIGNDVRLIGTRQPVMKVHKHLDEASYVECIWFNTLLELQTGAFNVIVLEQHNPEPTKINGEFPD